LDPADEPLRRAQDALAVGARGLKLHLTGEDFAVDGRRLEPVYALADERRLPVIVHAGPELETIGESVLALLERHDDLRMILAHVALPDLAWLWREAPSHPNSSSTRRGEEPARRSCCSRSCPPDRCCARATCPTARRCRPRALSKVRIVDT
jgi:uncharacterized protein